MSTLSSEQIVPSRQDEVLDFLDSLSSHQVSLLDDLVWQAKCEKDFYGDEDDE